ncbi:kinesin-like protein KIF6 isoform X4 [Nomascus leucogenys]|uniref:kinesin-like protein KIF6 isoform X4 n=1 Tax=Nomascus leucogenys TaxID=61853 RepID=UPI00062AA62D|nr:kinesin-like protein KIF6 isoform X4 [Nomascus leucogenys]
MVKQTIQIFARVKPPVRKHQQGIYSIDEDEKLIPSLEIILPRDLADGFVNNKRESYKFKFQRIFDQDANQETIFENIAKPVAGSPAGTGSTQQVCSSQGLQDEAPVQLYSIFPQSSMF